MESITPNYKDKILMKGNEAMAEAAIVAGCRYYFCYPITPQTEIAEYLARRMKEVGGVFLQAESELGAGNMVFGAAAAGARVFTSSSSPGMSLMQETISYIAGAELPCVFINVVRCGPGLGGILPAQSDYFQSTRGGGHGDYRTLVYAPSSVQESFDLTIKAFNVADKYRNPVLILSDGMIGQMMEPVQFSEPAHLTLPIKDWATTGAKNRGANVVKSLYLNPVELEKSNLRLQSKYDQMNKNEIMYEKYKISKNNEILVVAYGSMSRVVKTSIEILKKKINIGLLRPITLFPFPLNEINDCATNVRVVISIELSLGQMVEDVERAVNGIKPVEFIGRTGGIVPSPEEVAERITGIFSTSS